MGWKLGLHGDGLAYDCAVLTPQLDYAKKSVVWLLSCICSAQMLIFGLWLV